MRRTIIFIAMRLLTASMKTSNSSTSEELAEALSFNILARTKTPYRTPYRLPQSQQQTNRCKAFLASTQALRVLAHPLCRRLLRRLHLQLELLQAVVEYDLAEVTPVSQRVREEQLGAQGDV